MINDYIADITQALQKIDLVSIIQTVDAIKEAKSTNHYIYTFGNGGSGSTASHFASDLSKACGCKAFCLNDQMPALTAWANDDFYDGAFAKILSNIIREKDLAIGFSCSGKSKNVLNAIKKAREVKAITIGFTAFDGGELKDLVDIPIIVPVSNMEQAEDLHLLISHIIKTCLLKGV